MGTQDKIGYLGKGNYKTKINGVHTIQHIYWVNMLKRCYNEKYIKTQPTYEDKYVCEEWLNFQTFAKWFDENYYECDDGYKMDLDKDILNKDNKVYSPDTCIFVSHRINLLFTKRQNRRGEYPIGVCKRKDKLFSQCNTLDGKKHLGYYNTPEDAFYKGYKPFKEAYIKEIAEEYKDKIPQNLYEAMYSWEVNIDD